MDPEIGFELAPVRVGQRLGIRDYPGVDIPRARFYTHFVMVSTAFFIGALLAAPCRAENATPNPQEVKSALTRIETVFLSFREEPQPRAGEVALGRLLFFDPRLSKDRLMSCASCHQPALAWTDGLKRVRGAGHKELQRNTPTLLDISGRGPFFRDGRSATLEEQALVPVQLAEEMGMTTPEVGARLARVPDYVRRFLAVYGGPPRAKETARALAAFERTIKSPHDSAFDRYRGGAPLAPEAARGMILFAGKAHCVQCHAGPDFTDGLFHNVGHKREDPVDAGRFAVIPLEGAFRAFKTPSLRDASWTPPYFHDGSEPDLRAVVDFYDRGGDEAEGRDALIKPLNLSEGEKLDLLAFLDALTSSPAPVMAPVLPPDEESAPGGDAVSGVIAAVARAAEQEEAGELRGEAAALEAQIRIRSKIIASTGAKAPRCLDEMEGRARVLAYGPALSPAAARARARELGRAWEDCAAVNALLDAPEAAGTFADAAAALTRAEALLAGAPATVAAVDCRKAFDPDALISSLRDGKYEGPLADALGMESFEDAVSWRAYHALSSGRASDCDPLKGLSRNYNGIKRDAAASCREQSASMRFARALMLRSSDWPEACRESLAQGYATIPPEDVGRVCALISEGVDEPESLCRTLIPRYLDADRMTSCVSEFTLFASKGDGGDCGEIVAGAEVLRGRCAAIKKFRQVRGSGIAACGSHDACRALAGDARPLLGWLKSRGANAACALTTRASVTDRRVALARARRAAVSAHGALEAAEKARSTSDRSAAAKIDDASGRLAYLESKLEAELAALPVEEKRE